VIVRRDRRAQAASKQQAAAASSDLPKRVASGAAMAVLALGVAWIGGIVFVMFWAAAAALIVWEWVRITQRPLWVVPGLVYAGIAFAGPVVLRDDPQFGLVAILFLFAVVWATDILGYVVGRLVGGPKLWPAVSPKKTWSGAIGGTVGAALAGAVVAQLNALALVPVAMLAVVLSVAAQAGDLMESALKRRFNVKDASQLIPGHGGVMDRLDGFIMAAFLSALIGLARGGMINPGRGLLAW
jgi:phosphatidate cytidylyltransferase